MELNWAAKPEFFPESIYQIASPSEPIGLMRPISSEENSKTYNELGRCEFLVALKAHFPQFGDSLKMLVLEHYQQCSREDFLKLFNHWCTSANVVDVWLRDLCLQTACFWFEGRFSVVWAYYPNDPVIQYFRPVFSDLRPYVKPHPKMKDDLGSGRFWDAFAPPEYREDLDDFERRMQAQFSKQLRRYTRSIKARLAINKPQTTTHAAWTALMMSGRSAGWVWRNWPQAEMRKYSEPERAIYHAVKRFAREIGLTLQLSRTKSAA